MSKKDETVYVNDSVELDDFVSLENHIEFCNKIKLEIDKMGGISPAVEIEKYNHNYDPNDYYRLIVSFRRPENEEERKKRLSEEEARRLKEENDQRKLYEKLHKRFGKPS